MSLNFSSQFVSLIKMPNVDLPFVLHTEASRMSISAVVSQKYGYQLFLVAFGSRLPTSMRKITVPLNKKHWP